MIAKRRRPNFKHARSTRRPAFKLTVPVTWENVAGAASRPARERRPRSHVTSWRMRAKAALSALLTSPRWASFVLLLVVGLVVFFVGRERTYYVSQVGVRGTVTLARDAVIGASGVTGAHMFWLDPAETAQRVANMPNVLTATVEIAWPNRVEIAIKERAPVMVWDQKGRRFWVDAQGKLMHARQEIPQLLVVLSQEEDDNFQAGDSLPPEVVSGALQLRKLRPNINALFYQRSTGLSYQDGRNWRAFFGTGNDMNQKLVVYETLVEDLLARGLWPEYISVINKDKPFYRAAESTG